MKHEVFISYSSQDKNIADAICHSLEQHGITCWIAPRDVQPGSPYAREIIKGIKNCQVMLLVFTSHSNTSEHVSNEIDTAFNNGKIIIPFLVEDVPMDEELKYYLSRKHWLVAYPDYEKRFSELVNAVSNVIGRKAENPTIFPPEPISINLSPKEESSVYLKVLANIDCRILIDCEDVGIARANSLLKLPLRASEYYVQFISTENESDIITCDISLEHDILIKVDLLSEKEKREKEEFEILNAKYTPYISNGKCGYINEKTMQIIIPCIYEHVAEFSDNLAKVKLNGKYGFINRKGKQIIPCEYDDAFSFHNNLAAVKLNCKWGFIDKTGECITSFKYKLVESFSEELALVKNEKGYGYINKNGYEIISCQYNEARSFSEGLACVKQEKRWAFIDKWGRNITSFKYEYAESFSEGLALVEFEWQRGFINHLGTNIIPCKYGEVWSFSEGLASWKTGGKRGYIDKSEHVIISRLYWLASNFSEGLACVAKDVYHFGFIDKLGNERIPLKYSNAGSFSEGLACVKSNEGWGFINKSGKNITPFIYEYAESFSEGLAKVEIGGRIGYVDTFGNDTFGNQMNDK